MTVKMHVNPNPTVDDVMVDLEQQMIAGSTFRIEDGATTVINDRFRQSFEDRLARPGTWDRDGAAVRNAARQVGVIASAIASIRQQTLVTRPMVETATALVQEQCQIGFHEGQWCVDNPPPHP